MLLGDHRSWKGTGSMRRSVVKKNEIMYVPLLKTLEDLLQCNDIVAEVCTYHAYLSTLNNLLGRET